MAWRSAHFIPVATSPVLAYDFCNNGRGGCAMNMMDKPSALRGQ
jgi:hypothetical protein